jgi:hypothetical protein
MAAGKKQEKSEISVVEIAQGSINFCLLGRTPFFCNRMSEKARFELLFPKGKKNAAEKASSLKHEPIKEFRDSAYVTTDDDQPTRVLMLAAAFKRALESCALDMPGDAKKAQIGRLTWAEGTYVNMFGIPQLSMAVIRNKDMNRTPDVRSRAVLPEWACRVEISFVKPILREQTVANLLAAAGMMRGVGDWRVEKGAGNNGQFTLVDEDNADFKRIIKTGGLKAQDAAFADPIPFDKETADLYEWFKGETSRRGFKVAV